MLFRSELTVGRLGLRNTKITELPNGLTVEILDLTNTKITELPNGLIVEILDLTNSKIIELPDDIKIDNLITDKGSTFVASEETQLMLIGKNKDMLTVIKRPTENALQLHNMLWEI